MRADEMKRRAGELRGCYREGWRPGDVAEVLAILRAVAGGEVFDCKAESVLLGGLKIPQEVTLIRDVHAFDTTARRVQLGDVLVIQGGEDGGG